MCRPWASAFCKSGAPSGIKGRQGGHLIEFIVDQPQRAADLLREGEDRWRVSLFGDRLHVITDLDVDAGIRDTTARLAAAGIGVRDAHEERYSLEDVFIVVVEKARKEGKVSKED